MWLWKTHFLSFVFPFFFYFLVMSCTVITSDARMSVSFLLHFRFYRFLISSLFFLALVFFLMVYLVAILPYSINLQFSFMPLSAAHLFSSQFPFSVGQVHLLFSFVFIFSTFFSPIPPSCHNFYCAHV